MSNKKPSEKRQGRGTSDAGLLPRPSEWAARILSLFPGAPVEVSMSGRGLHIWGFGPNVSRVFTLDGQRVEVYADKRYIAVTGNWLRRGKLGDLSVGLTELGVL